MSRTDKTDPHAVKVRTHRAEHHDHANGICELRADPDRMFGRRGECYITGDYWRRIFRCCCVSCTDPTREPAMERRRGKAAVRDWRREYD